MDESLTGLAPSVETQWGFETPFAEAEQPSGTWSFATADPAGVVGEPEELDQVGTAAASRPQARPDLGLTAQQVGSSDRAFDGAAGKAFAQLVTHVAREVDLNPGLVAENLIAEAQRSVYLRKTRVSSYEVGVDDFYERREAVRKVVPAAARITWDPASQHTHPNDADRPRLVTTINFASGRDAALASAATLKYCESVLIGVARSEGKSFTALPIESRFTLLRLAFNAGIGRARRELRSVLAGGDVLIRTRQSKAGPQRKATIHTGRALHLSSAIFSINPTSHPTREWERLSQFSEGEFQSPFEETWEAGDPAEWEAEDVRDLFPRPAPESEEEGFPLGLVLTPGTGNTGERQEHWDPYNTGLPLLSTGPAVRNQRLSQHFTVGELVRSGGTYSDVARISPALVRLLQGMRDRSGRPVSVLSGYRSWGRNQQVYAARGKKPTLSRHCSGQAADIRIAGLSGLDIAKLALDVGGPDLGVGIGGNYAHVDVRGTWASWTYLSGDAGRRATTEIANYRANRGASRPGTPTHQPRPAGNPPATGSTGGGRLIVSRHPVLQRHAGTAPDLVLGWNRMTKPTTIDVVVHLHGFSASRDRMSVVDEIAPISGLDLAGRNRPTLSVLPRGNYYGGKTGRGYSFPQLVKPGALDHLVTDALARFSAETGIRAPRGRLLLTAHSGGGAALNAVLGHTDPDEVLIYDGLYGPSPAVIAWAVKRISRDIAQPASVAPALRVFYRAGTKQYPGTQPHSEAVGEALCRALKSAQVPERLRTRFRVEKTTVGHGDIPRAYGRLLLADAAADVAKVTRYACPPAAVKESYEDSGVASELWEDSVMETDWTEAEDFEPELFLVETSAAGVTAEDLEPGEPEDFEPEDFEPEDEEDYSVVDTASEDFEDQDEGYEQDENEGLEAEGFEDEEPEEEQGYEDFEDDREGVDTWSENGEPSGLAAEDLAWAEDEAVVVEGETFPSGASLATTSGATGEGQEHWDPQKAGLPLLATGPSQRGIKLSANFTVGELVYSGGQHADVARISPELVRLLQAIRERAGRPVKITSGYRSWKRNKALYAARGKKPTLSRHCSGQAADITIKGLSGLDIAKLALDVGGTKVAIGLGRTFAHVDVRGTWAVWNYVGGTEGRALEAAATAYRSARAQGRPPTSGQPSTVPATSQPPKQAGTRTNRQAGVVPYQSAKSDSKGPQPGAIALRDHWRRTTGLKQVDIYNPRDIRGKTGRVSVHSEGRALDLYANAKDPAQRGLADKYVAWLIANAVELQCQYIIWNARQWSWQKRSQGWRPYTGQSPHTDHIHVELSWEGARSPSRLFTA